MPQRLRFCIDPGPAGWVRSQQSGDSQAIRAAVQRTIDLGIAADRAGLDSLWLLEDPDSWDAFAILGAIARQTTNIRLGPGVVNPYYRHPSLMAASVTTLDFLSSGRAFLGLGRGQTEWYDRALGMNIGSPTKRLPETISLLRQWWTEEMFARSLPNMEELGVQGWQRELRPLQNHTPIYLAAVGPVAMKIAAEWADGVIFNDLTSFDFMRDQISNVKRMAAAVGRDADALTFYARCQVTVTNDPEALYEKRKTTIAMIHALPGMERLLQSDAHDIDTIIADVRKAMRVNEILEAGGAFSQLRTKGNLQAAREAIPTSLMSELVVAGDLPTIRRKLSDLADIGVTHVFLAAPATIEDLPGIVKSLQQ